MSADGSVADVYADSTWRSLARCFAAVVVLQVVATTIGVLARPAPLTIALHLPLVVAELVVVRASWHGSLETVHVGWLQTVVLGTLLVAVVLGESTQSLLNPMCVAAVSAVVIRRAWAVALVVADAVAFCVGRLATVPGPYRVDLGIAITDGVVVLQNAAYAYVVMAISMLAASSADRTAAVREEASRRLAREQTAVVERRRVSAEIHDEVLHALALIARGHDVLLRPAGQRQVQRAIAVLEGRATGVDIGTAIADAARDLRLRVRLTAATSSEPPPAVGAALALAAIESLRNVSMHADATDVRVDVSLAADRARISIADDGRGFSDHAPASRHGLRGSIRRRMSDVGGRAEITSSPGNGTLVELTWFQAAPPTTVDAFERVRQHAARPVWWLLPPGFGGMLAAVSMTLDEMARPWLGVVVALLTVLLATVVTWRMRPLRLSTNTYAAGLLAAPCLVALNGLAVGDGWSNAYAIFCLGGLGPPLGIIGLLGTTRQAVGITGVLLAVLTGVLVITEPVASADGLIGCYAALLFTTVIGLALRRMIDSLGNAASSEEEAASAATAELEEAAIRASVRRESLLSLRESVLPYLRSWDVGHGRPGRASDRLRAATLEAAARDSLALPGMLDGACVAQLADARRLGTAVELRCDQEDPPTVYGPAVSTMLSNLLSQQRWLSVVVTLWTHDAAAASMVLVCDGPPLDLRAHREPGVSVERIGTITRLEARLTPTDLELCAER